jgi:hypothetical protein
MVHTQILRLSVKVLKVNSPFATIEAPAFHYKLLWEHIAAICRIPRYPDSGRVIDHPRVMRFPLNGCETGSRKVDRVGPGSGGKFPRVHFTPTNGQSAAISPVSRVIEPEVL